jgi:hypothetical protein
MIPAVPSTNKTSERRKLVFGANTAQTPEQIKYMREWVDDWLRSHPEDENVQRAARQLDRSEDRLRKAGGWH